MFEELKKELHKKNLPVATVEKDGKFLLLLRQSPDFGHPAFIIEQEDENNYTYIAQSTEGVMLYQRGKAPLRMLIEDIELALENKTPVPTTEKFYKEKFYSP